MWLFHFSAWVLALLPAIIIAQHAFFLYKFRRRVSTKKVDLTKGKMAFLQPAWNAVSSEEQVEFSPRMLWVRYGGPALLIVVLVVTWYYFPWLPLQCMEPFQGPFLLGAIGAYVYVLLQLGQRNFRRDITSGICIWCAATLALGPILAAVVSFLWKKAGGTDVNNWGTASVYFLAGLSPRYVSSVIDEAARRLLLSPSGAASSQRTLPLTHVRGITPDIADRLSEEGIYDIYGLASANANRLLRTTSFDPRQILSWIDEAILIATLPKIRDELEAAGITGAIDLAWYYLESEYSQQTSPPIPSPPPSAQVNTLAGRLKLEADLLWAVILRLYQDAQVQRVWVLYQVDSEEVPSTRSEDAPSSPPESEKKTGKPWYRFWLGV